MTSNDTTIRIELSKQGKNRGLCEALVDKQDSEFAKLNWSVLKSPYTYYARRSVDSGVELLHRLILEKMLERKLFSDEYCDHVNGLGWDNRRENLRLASRSQNNRNANKRIDNSSGYKGVYWYKQTKKWKTQIRFNNKKIHIGYFKSKEDAAKAYRDKADELHREFANYGKGK